MKAFEIFANIYLVVLIVTFVYLIIYGVILKTTERLKDDFSNLKEFESLMDNDLYNLWVTFRKNELNGYTYNDLKAWQYIFKPYGLTFDFDLSAEPTNFKLKY